MSLDTVTSLVQGVYTDPETGEALSVPTGRVDIADTLEGMEDELVRALDLEPPLAVVCDPLTYEALGARVERALTSVGPTRTVMLGNRPHADLETAERVRLDTVDCNALIAVGSGTINDLCKYAAARDNKPTAVFATAPSMNGYTSVNAAITVEGHKKSLPATAPKGVFMDLGVLTRAPKRMIRSGLGDTLCRCTAQADWLMAHILNGGEYRETPFVLLAEDEEALLAEPEALVSGDKEAMSRLCRTLVLSGFGMTICGGSYPASQGEHLISHYIEMMHPPDWPLVFHGEQIAVTTLVMARLQERVLAERSLRVGPSPETREDVVGHFGQEIGDACWREFDLKRLDGPGAEALNQRLEEKWPEIRHRVGRVMGNAAALASILERAGAPTAHEDILLNREFLGRAIMHARQIRNRYTFLDLAADAGLLDPEALV